MQQQKLLINGDRLKKELERFAGFGRTENNGVTRLSLSQADRSVRDYFCSMCEDLGMEVKVDDMGSIYATYATHATLKGATDRPPIVLGSHLDTVKKGGRFDGVLGVAAGLEIVRTLIDHNIEPAIPITVVNFTNEEGARFEPSMMASGVLSGKFDKAEMCEKTDADGVTFAQALRSSGYEGKIENRLKEAAAFLELHIEQGPVLENEQLSIGVVEGVVGMACYEIEITGESNHAGTTPMHLRRDALFAANDLITEIRKQVGMIDPELVFTLGRLNVYPNIHTVIPNKVVFSFEARHKQQEVVRRVEEIIKSLSSFSNAEGCTIKTKKLWGRDTVWFDKALCQIVEEAVITLGYSYKKMVSGAGHDAQFIASYIPSTMVFVPSNDGKSHCEEEVTAWDECEKGVNVLLESVLTLLGRK